MTRTPGSKCLTFAQWQQSHAARIKAECGVTWREAWEQVEASNDRFQWEKYLASSKEPINTTVAASLLELVGFSVLQFWYTVNRLELTVTEKATQWINSHHASRDKQTESST